MNYLSLVSDPGLLSWLTLKMVWKEIKMIRLTDCILKRPVFENWIKYGKCCIKIKNL